jgi:hypothetical protein
MGPKEKRNPLLAIYEAQLDEALERLRLAERLIQEAGTLEDLDIGRTTFQSAQAEVSQLIRLAKKECGIALRPISEVETKFGQLLHRMGMLTDGMAVGEVTGAPAQPMASIIIRSSGSGMGAV